VPPTRRVLAIGGGGFTTSVHDLPLDRWALSLTPADSPSVCLLPTASGDPEHQIERFYATFRGLAGQLSHISLFRLGARPLSLRRHLFAQDMIYVGGGSLVNLLALWRAHGLDRTLEDACGRGTVLCGVSAGAMCWFEAGVTRSRGRPEVTPGLGLLPGSLSVHHDSDAARGNSQRRALQNGMPAGYALDDGVGLLFDDGEPTLAVSAREGARAYRCALEGGVASETPIDPVLLEPDRPSSSSSVTSIDELRELRRHRALRGA
jgi:peptidase E